MIIAIDGPSGAGKGTVARSLARALEFRHIDTGAMYRAVAWAAVRQGLPCDDEASVAALAERSTIEVAERIAIDGVDVTTAIRTPEIDRAAAQVARLPRVRAILVDRQRALGADGNVVMEGRDIGTTVFPAADLKIYLDAEPAERARRRANDPAHRREGPVSLGAVASALDERDASDRSRNTSPLAIAPDANVIDTTRLSVAEVVDRVLVLVRQRLAG